MNVKWEQCGDDIYLKRAVISDVYYHICTSVGRVSWWSEFCDEPNYVSDTDEAEHAVIRYHQKLEN